MMKSRKLNRLCLHTIDYPRHYKKLVLLIAVLMLASLIVQSAIYTPIHYTVNSFIDPERDTVEKIPDHILNIVTAENASDILNDEVNGAAWRGEDGNTSIPKIIHQIYANDQIPSVYGPLISSWLKYHPDHEYWLWDDISGRQLVEKHYPKFLPLWDAYCHPLFRSDALRYFILHKYGGMYMDMDYVAYKSVRPLLDHIQCAVVEENRPQARFLYRIPDVIMNAFLASVPNHPYMHYLINSLPSSASCYFHDVLKSTGPLFIHRARLRFLEISRCNQFESCFVHILPSGKMMPGWDPNAIEIARRYCKKNTRLSVLQMEQCKFFASVNFSDESRKKSDEVHADHLFLHLGNFARKDNSVKLIDIRRFVPHVIIPRNGKI